jgi:putative membrane protein
MMGFGFVVARFGLFMRELAAAGNQNAPGGHGGSLIMGVTLAGMGVWVIAVAAFRYRRYNEALSAGKDIPPPGALFGLSVSGFLIALGIFIVIYLVTFG